MSEENLKDSGDVQIYETGYHVLESVSEEDLQGEVSKIHAIISENGGNIISEGAPALRQLAYTISKKVGTKTLKFSKAYFGWVKFEVNRENILKIKETIESMPSILRFIIIKTVRENTMHTPKIPMFKKENVSEEEGDDKLAEREKTPASEAEIDKSIDELIIEN
jgi:ribosomal protein S6